MKKVTDDFDLSLNDLVAMAEKLDQVAERLTHPFARRQPEIGI